MTPAPVSSAAFASVIVAQTRPSDFLLAADAGLATRATETVIAAMTNILGISIVLFPSCVGLFRRSLSRERSGVAADAQICAVRFGRWEVDLHNDEEKIVYVAVRTTEVCVQMESGLLHRGGKVLLLTLGSTPQVVTETIHALITQDPPWIPDRIVLATTDHGARLFREGRSIEGRRSIEPLLGPDGMIARLAEQFGVDLPSGCIEVEVPLGNGGHPIEDIRTEDETKSFAECLLRIVSGVTATAGTELHVSLAGGRKTMSFIAGQIMSMFGRHQDHLSHVLVEPQALEREDGFWWPGDSSPGSDEACVKLYLVPFFRARAWLDPARLVDVSPGYALTVDMANQSLGRVHTEIDLSENTLHMCGRTIELGAQQLAALSLIFIAAKRALPLESVLGWCSTDGKRRGLAMSGDRKTTHRLWAFLNSCCRLQKNLRGRPCRPLCLI